MADRAKLIYNDKVVNVLKELGYDRNKRMQLQNENPDIRIMEPEDVRTYDNPILNALGRINQAAERFTMGRALYPDEMPEQFKRDSWGTLLNMLGVMRPGAGMMGSLTRSMKPFRGQDNTNPSTGVNELNPGGNYPNINARGEQQVPDSNMLGSIARLESPGSAEPTTSQPLNIRRHDLMEYDPPYDNYLMQANRNVGITSRNGNLLVPANRTPTQEYNAASIIQQNPELARHLGLLKAIKGQ